MTYSTGGTIAAADFNTLLATVSRIYGKGQGERGYGQTAITLDPVTPKSDHSPDKVLASDWSKLREMVAVCASHQGTSLAGLAPAPVIGDKIGVITGLVEAVTAIDTNRNLTIPGSMTLASSVFVSARTTTWLGVMTNVVDIAFPTEDAARHFFNSGGEVRMRLSHPIGSSGQDQTLRSGFTTEIGTISLKANASTVTGTASHNSFGYYGLTDTPRQKINTTFADYGYGGTTVEKNKFSLTVQRLYHAFTDSGNGTGVRFMFTLDSGHMCAVGTKVEFDVYRATTHLAGIVAPTFLDISNGWIGGAGSAEPAVGGSDTFAFNFNDVSNAEVSTVITSTPITIPTLASGYLVASVSAPAALSVNGGAFAQSVEVSSGNTLRVRGVSSSAFATAASTIVTIGNNTDNWIITTRAPAEAPSGSDIFPIDLGTLTNKNTDTVYESNVVTIPTLASPTLLGYLGNGFGSMSVRKNGGAWSDYFDGTGTAPSFYVASGDTVQARVKTGTEPNRTFGRFLFIGPNNGQFNVSTSAGAGNNSFYFSFDDVVGAQTNTLVTSNPITIPLLATSTLTARVSAGSNQAALSVNGGDWAQMVTVSSGNTLRVRALSSATTGTTNTVVVNIGDNIDQWSITTEAATVGATLVGDEIRWAVGSHPPGTYSLTPTEPLYDSALTGPVSKEWRFPQGIQAGDMLVYVLSADGTIIPPPGFITLGTDTRLGGSQAQIVYGYKIATGTETGNVGARQSHGYVTGGIVAIRGFTTVAFHDAFLEKSAPTSQWSPAVDPQASAYLFWTFACHPGVNYGMQPKNPKGFKKAVVLYPDAAASGTNQSNYNPRTRRYYEAMMGGVGIRFNEPNEAVPPMSWDTGPAWGRASVNFRIKLR